MNQCSRCADEIGLRVFQNASTESCGQTVPGEFMTGQPQKQIAYVKAVAGVRMIMPSVMVLGNACYEGPPQFEGSGSVTCSAKGVGVPDWVCGERAIIRAAIIGGPRMRGHSTAMSACLVQSASDWASSGERADDRCTKVPSASALGHLDGAACSDHNTAKLATSLTTVGSRPTAMARDDGAGTRRKSHLPHAQVAE